MAAGRVTTDERRVYMRNYMRKRNGITKPRKEKYVDRFAAFRAIVLAGRYGSISEICRKLEIATMTGSRWLKKIRLTKTVRAQ